MTRTLEVLPDAPSSFVASRTRTVGRGSSLKIVPLAVHFRNTAPVTFESRTGTFSSVS